jgi:hypothetical protein
LAVGLDDHQVVSGEWMTVLTMGLPSVHSGDAGSPEDVLSLGDYFQMIRVTAIAYSAQMIDLLANWDRPLHVEVSHSMGEPHDSPFSAAPDHAVAVTLLGSSPEPTPVVIDLDPSEQSLHHICHTEGV